MHQVVKGLYERNILIPVTQEATMILDIGNGSGAWVIEVANEFPNTKLIGLDLAPIQPVQILDNCEFRIADLRTALKDYQDDSVDLHNSC